MLDDQPRDVHGLLKGVNLDCVTCAIITIGMGRNQRELTDMSARLAVALV